MKEPEAFLPKKGNYRGLIVYQKAECIYDITFFFAHHYFVERKDRTSDQVIQAARSGKQNIAEGSAASTTSAETEIKLLGVARASMQETLLDYEDYPFGRICNPPFGRICNPPTGNIRIYNPPRAVLCG